MSVKRLWVLLLALVLVSCGEPLAQTAPSGEEVPSVSFEEREGVLGLVVDGLCRYTVIRPEYASERERVAAGRIDTMLFHELNVHIPVKNDFAAPSELEILVGNTNRQESKELMATLSQQEFAVAVVGRKLVICGGGEKALEKAVDWFLRTYVENQSLEEGEIPSLVITLAEPHRGRI